MTGYSPMTFNSLTTSPNICVYIGENWHFEGFICLVGTFSKCSFKKKKCP